ncbi:hypothetical protein DSC45_27635 [Streptomyces sp. YIM 130001]|uniref:hypothetical protein n=1 Tax=Streptomyces sp. YIM 130001 TaxID=2259644 RepID=UPI000E65CE66|nr:hypothetical protein [Streptomyces sp. YIM 130001]RII11686.1 hypothetical protein DSC45_27635 [Streptomyces sp. YIM 130001]
MRTGLRIGAFVTALAATFGTAYAVGDGVGPVGGDGGREQEAGHGHDGGDTGTGGEAGGHGAEPPGGLQISQDGYTLDLETPRIAAGEKAELRFAIEDGSGRHVTAYQRQHEKELHLIVASRDLGEYRHLHPERAADGTWSTPVELPRAGGYRMFADFRPKGGEGLTLGADLAVTGDYAPRELPEQRATADAGDGYEVTLDGSLTPGKAGELELAVARNGRPVTDLQPYLGAYGHLVALRAGDLAYLHVHPNEGEPGPVSFTATTPSKGSYRLFLDFKHDGKVRTAAFTVQAGSGTGGGSGGDGGAAEEHEPESDGGAAEEHGAGGDGGTGGGHGH